MPYDSTVYKCDHCGDWFNCYDEAAEHERTCLKNPAMKACLTCRKQYNKVGREIQCVHRVSRREVHCRYWEWYE